MTKLSASIRRLVRAVGALVRRGNAASTPPTRRPLPASMSESSAARLKFATLAMEVALATALRHAVETRKREEGLTHGKLARSCGRHRSAVSKTLSAQDWRLSTLSDFAEALCLRLEFAFVDRKYPQRRFTPNGVEFVQADPGEAESGS